MIEKCNAIDTIDTGELDLKNDYNLKLKRKCLVVIIIILFLNLINGQKIFRWLIKTSKFSN